MNTLSLIIPAAGSGVRLGTEIPKPFIQIGSATILEHTLRRFISYDGLKQIIIATSESYSDDVEKILEGIRKKGLQCKVVIGGSERQYSIYNALQEVDDSIDLIAVHDAVRPFISLAVIQQCCKTAGEFGGAVVGVPAKDTIKKVNSSLEIKETPDRSHLWQAQTPQIFRRDLLCKAYKKAMEQNYLGTDDSSLVENIGGAVKMVEGERENLKITYPIDLKVAELILRTSHE